MICRNIKANGQQVSLKLFTFSYLAMQKYFGHNIKKNSSFYNMQTSSSYIVKGKIGQAWAMVELGLGYSYKCNFFCIKDSMHVMQVASTLFSAQCYVGR